MTVVGIPDVTAVLVTYNRADSLDATIRDIVEQSFVDFRLVICDDASPDHTEEVCRTWVARDERITYIRRSKNLGMPENLNTALVGIQSRYVAVLHDGNRYDPQALEMWRRALVDNPRAAFVFNQIAVMDRSGATVSICREPMGGVVNGKWLLRRVFFRRWGFGSPVFGVAMVRRLALECEGLLDPRYWFYADVDLWMRLLHDWDAAYVARPLVRIYPRQLQPNQFQRDAWELAWLMHDLFHHHRMIEFAGDRWLRRCYEMTVHRCYCRADDAFRLLLLFRRGDFESLDRARNYLRRNAVSLLPLWWVVIHLRRLRPLLFPGAARRFALEVRD